MLEYTVEDRIQMKKNENEYKVQMTSRLKKSCELLKKDMDSYCVKIGIPKINTERSEYDEIQRIIAAQEYVRNNAQP